MIESLQGFTESLPLPLQWVGVMVAGAIPFVDSEGAATIGVISGINPPIAIAAAIVGNVIAVWLLISLSGNIRGKVARPAGESASPKRQKLRRSFDKFGVPGVSLLGPTILPTHITSVAMISFGAKKNAVLLWQTIAIILWGVAFGIIATIGVGLLF
ncbi:hypothetical protein [Arthrobacter sp. H5]|uniref:hypothetical protein n=1 Tax=Arthrobacter sp. H5 TaxID=1267973 RepID=UPI000485D29A|nr:hypothetical protein [Arthrobacter sp. H5]